MTRRRKPVSAPVPPDPQPALALTALPHQLPVHYERMPIRRSLRYDQELVASDHPVSNVN